jgi:hypothetical protein
MICLQQLCAIAGIASRSERRRTGTGAVKAQNKPNQTNTASIENDIAATAYQWLAAGKPSGRDQEFWLRPNRTSVCPFDSDSKLPSKNIGVGVSSDAHAAGAP